MGIEGLTAVYRDHLGKGNSFRFRALGGSMFPLIRSGDCLRVAPAKRYRPGDILLYEREGQWCAHRLIRIDPHSRMLTFQGDAQTANDPPVPAEAVMGRVRVVERHGAVIHLDGWRDRLWRLLLRIPWVRSPLLPLTWRLLARLKRACINLTRPGSCRP
ncbi:MAG: hypothetical protein HZA23_04365 [Nitrospirae bacterium]|nr:hypothetical protein [Nitrospirota bacterium]